MSSTAPAGPFWLKALTLSILVHFLVARLFLFVWPLKKAEPRPQLVFFGAILDRSELMGLTAPHHDERIILQPRRINYHASRTAAPYEDRGVNKPAYPEAVAREGRQPQKVNYLPEDDPPPEPMPAAETPQVDLPETPKYQPLRLKPN